MELDAFTSHAIAHLARTSPTLLPGCVLLLEGALARLQVPAHFCAAMSRHSRAWISLLLAVLSLCAYAICYMPALVPVCLPTLSVCMQTSPQAHRGEEAASRIVSPLTPSLAPHAQERTPQGRDRCSMRKALRRRAEVCPGTQHLAPALSHSVALDRLWAPGPSSTKPLARVVSRAQVRLSQAHGKVSVSC